MSAIKIVINPHNGRLNGIELVDPNGSSGTEANLFMVYQILADEIQQFTKRTSHKVQLNKLMSGIGHSGESSKDGKETSPTILIDRPLDGTELVHCDLDPPIE